MSALVSGASVHIHRHLYGRDCLTAAGNRARNTTIVIGADQRAGVLLLDIDVQADTVADAGELREQLLLVAEALEGYDPLRDDEADE